MFGYLLSVIFTVAGIAPLIDFSGISKTISEVGFFSLPRLVFFTSHKPVFDLGAFFTIASSFWYPPRRPPAPPQPSAPEPWGRDIKMEELRGSLAVDGFSSAISGCFGCPAADFLQPECGSGDHDRRDQPLYHFHRGADPDSGLSVPAPGRFL